MPTIISLVLIAAAMAVICGLIRAADAFLKMRTTARTRHFRDEQFVAQAAAEVRNV